MSDISPMTLAGERSRAQRWRRALVRAVLALVLLVAVLSSATAAWSWPTCD